MDYEWGPPRATVSVIEHALLRSFIWPLGAEDGTETGRKEVDNTKIITRAEARKSKLYTPPPA